MLREADGVKRIILVCGKTDLRRGLTGLSAVIRLAYGMNPMEEGTLFLFCGSRRDRIRGLLYEGDGWVIINKYLCQGSHFQWPRNSDEARDISAEEFRRLMDGFTVESSIRKIPKNTENPASGRPSGKSG
jgi:transposase